MAKTKILIVDDDSTTRLVLSARLKAKNYDTVFAADSYQAVSAARKDQPNLIILDLGLPGGDGFLVLQRLKALTTLASIPVIVVTAEDRRVAEPKALEAGAVAFLQKPVDGDQLLAAVKNALGDAGEPMEKRVQ